MKYENIIIGNFLDRPNRFIANVEIDGVKEVVHVKNKGRCRRLLNPGVKVSLEKADNPGRKTKYDLIAVEDAKLGWVNIDSQAPNKVVLEWLKTRNYDYVKPEYVYGDSRIDFYMEKDGTRYLMEVKGCTDEVDGIGYFPDAPTVRGVRHLRELIKAVSQGYECFIAFVIPMTGITEVRQNAKIHKEFADVFYEAKEAGVKVLNLSCMVTKDELKIQL